MYVTVKSANGNTRYFEIVYQLLSSYISNPERQCMYKVILRRVLVSVLHIVTVCLKCKVPALCYNLWHVWFCHIFLFYLVSCTNFGKKYLLITKCVIWSCLHPIFGIFSIIKRIQRDIVTNVSRFYSNVSVILVRFH